MIPFNKPPYTGREEQYVIQAMRSQKMSGDGPFTKKCHEWFEEKTGSLKTLLTPSCTHALELAAMLIDIQPGDEVIVPSYTFVSSANAFALRGATIVFVDIRPDTMNIDESKIEAAITPLTKAIVPVHYAGVACEMNTIMKIASRYNLYVIEDAAQAMMSTYFGKPLGTIGHLGAYSFHDTKNYTSGGEGGLLLINDETFKARAEIIREKGTNRSNFFRGMVDKYSWVDIGSSLLPSELQTAYLWGQLESVDLINTDRLELWKNYHNQLIDLEKKGRISLPHIPPSCAHNAHMFYIKVKDLDERTRLLEHLKKDSIIAAFHYIPLHSSSAGATFGRFHGVDNFTTTDSDRLLRLPLYHSLSKEDQHKVIESLLEFFQ